MSKRNATLMKRHLRGLSPEEFAAKHGNIVFYYSARSIRRWLKGATMPKEIRDRLLNRHTLSPEDR